MAKKTEFEPQLITNDKIPEGLKKEGRRVSRKRHGVAVIPHYKHDLIIGRSMKAIANVQFQEYFKPVLDYCKEHKLIFHTEAHITGCISDDMIRWLNATDLSKISKNSLVELDKNLALGKYKLPREKYLSFPTEMKLYAFDCLTETDYDNETLYDERFENLKIHAKNLSQYIEIIPQYTFETQEEEDAYYEKVLAEGDEGIVIRFNKPYKYGRSTSREELIYKKVPTPTFDGKIIAVNQGEELISKREDFIARLEKENLIPYNLVELTDEEVKTAYENAFGKLNTINKLGKSVTSKKKEDRVLINKAKDFQVEMWNEKIGKNINFGVALKGFDDEAKVELFENKENYIGKMIQFTSKPYEFIGCPKSATFEKWRPDRD